MSCINKSRTTWDFCRECNGKDLECPEYLPDWRLKKKKLTLKQFVESESEVMIHYSNILPTEAKHFPLATLCNEVDMNNPQHFLQGPVETPQRVLTPPSPSEANFYLHHRATREYVRPHSLNFIRRANDRGVI